MFALLCISAAAMLLNVGTDGAKVDAKPPDIAVCFGNNTKNVVIPADIIIATFSGPTEGSKGELCDDTLYGCQALCLKVRSCSAITFRPKSTDKGPAVCALYDRICNEHHKCKIAAPAANDYWQRTDTNGTHPQCPNTQRPKVVSNKNRLGVTAVPTTQSAQTKTRSPNIADCKNVWVTDDGGFMMDFSYPVQGSNNATSEDLKACQALCLKNPSCRGINITPSPFP